MVKIDQTAWLFACSALALLAVPGILLFHSAGLPRGERRASILRPLFAVPFVAVQWILIGYSLVFGGAPAGDDAWFSFSGLGLARDAHGAAPAIGFAVFEMACAVVAPMILTCAVGARMKASAAALVAVLWSTAVYDPVAHWVWAEHGWLSALGVLDFAGGVVVHLVGGCSALVCAAFLRSDDLRPPGAPTRSGAATLGGLALLWASCFALTGGSSLAGRGLGLRAIESTALAAIGGALGTRAGEWGRELGRPLRFGGASGPAVALVAITAAGGYVTPWTALAIGFIAGAVHCGTLSGAVSASVAGLLAITAAAGHVGPVNALSIAVLSGAICYAAVALRGRLGDDRGFETFSLHALGGLVGVLLTGVLAQKTLNGTGVDGAIFGNPGQFGLQVLACAATAGYGACATFLILRFVDATIGLRHSEDAALTEPA